MRRLLILAVASIVVSAGPSGGSAGPGQVVDRIDVVATCSGTQCTVTVKNTGPRDLHLVGVVVPGGATLAGVTGSNGGRCETQNSFSTCFYSSGGQPTFAVGQTRTLTFTTSIALPPGTQISVCASGRADGGDLFWIYPAVVPEGAESDLELELTVRPRTRLTHNSKDKPLKKWAEMTYRLVITNQGPSMSPGAKVRLRISRPVSPEESSGRVCTYRFPAVLITCIVGSLDRGEERRIALKVTTRKPTRYVARATVTGVNPDPVLANNRATRTTVVSR